MYIKQGFSMTNDKLLRTSLQCVVVKDMVDGARPKLEDCIIGPRDTWIHQRVFISTLLYKHINATGNREYRKLVTLLKRQFENNGLKGSGIESKRYTHQSQKYVIVKQV